jgi:hypothetical protein
MGNSVSAFELVLVVTLIAIGIGPDKENVSFLEGVFGIGLVLAVLSAAHELGKKRPVTREYIFNSLAAVNIAVLGVAALMGLWWLLSRLFSWFWSVTGLASISPERLFKFVIYVVVALWLLGVLTIVLSAVGNRKRNPRTPT